MNLVKHMSSNTTDRACLAYTRQSAFDKRQSLPRVSYTSTMKQIMGCYHLHIERTQTVRKNSSVGNDRPLSLICLLRSSSFSEAGLQALPSVLTSVHGPACVLLVVVPGPSPLCSLRVTTTPSSFVMHSGPVIYVVANTVRGLLDRKIKNKTPVRNCLISKLTTHCLILGWYVINVTPIWHPRTASVLCHKLKVAVSTIVPRSPCFAFCTPKYRLL